MILRERSLKVIHLDYLAASQLKRMGNRPRGGPTINKHYPANFFSQFNKVIQGKDEMKGVSSSSVFIPGSLK
jgi:hypothetical protein